MDLAQYNVIRWINTLVLNKHSHLLINQSKRNTFFLECQQVKWLINAFIRAEMKLMWQELIWNEQFSHNRHQFSSVQVQIRQIEEKVFNCLIGTMWKITVLTVIISNISATYGEVKVHFTTEEENSDIDPVSRLQSCIALYCIVWYCMVWYCIV